MALVLIDQIEEEIKKMSLAQFNQEMEPMIKKIKKLETRINLLKTLNANMQDICNFSEDEITQEDKEKIKEDWHEKYKEFLFN